MSTRTRQTSDHRDAPTYWFAVLELARERGDFERAVEAQRELRRLGITVRYGRLPADRRGPPMPTDPRIAGYTVADLARRYRVSEDRVRAWIERGELRALDRRDTRSTRPAYVITPEALEAFEARRAVVPTLKTARRKKRTNEIDFFPN